MEGAADPLAGQDRYGLNQEAELDEQPQAGEEDAESAADTGGASRRHLSAHERRRQKKPCELFKGLSTTITPLRLPLQL